MEQGFKPKVIAFLCNWCSYAGADLAGSLRYSYPPYLYAVRVPCSGRVEPEFIIKAFLSGADGVLVAGCHPGDCHYRTGNYYTHRRFNLLTRFLEIIGIPKQRVRLEWISGAEGLKFSQVAKDFIAKIQELGPLSIKVPNNIDLTTLLRTIATVGSAGKLFWDDDKCMADIVDFFLDYVQQNSCAECIPCRIGTKRMQESIHKVFDGSISERDFSLLKNLAEDIGASSKCDLGKMAGKAVQFTLQYCKDDLEAHIKGGCAKTIPANPGWQTIVMK